MALIYKGDSGKISVNGRPMKVGDTITDPREIADLSGHPDFEGGAPVVKTPKAKKPKAEKVE